MRYFVHDLSRDKTNNERTIFCGATILNSKWIVTAAHCVFDIPNTDEIALTAGHTDSQWSDAERNAHFTELTPLAIFIHKGWDESNVLGDLAMIKVVEFEFNPAIMPICLPPTTFEIEKSMSSEEEDGPVCIITGWGSTLGTGQSNVLQQATIPVSLLEMHLRILFLDNI